jgi:hypothetical protein
MSWYMEHFSLDLLLPCKQWKLKYVNVEFWLFSVHITILKTCSLACHIHITNFVLPPNSVMQHVFLRLRPVFLINVFLHI